MNSQSTANNGTIFFWSIVCKASVAFVFIMLMVVAGIIRIDAQRVYGVASRTTVVSTGSGTAVRRTTVVAAPVGLCCGYIAVLPVGYRVVGGGIFMYGSVRYRATFYQGRTVYIRI